MLSDEEKISLNRMKLFARSSDLSVVTEKDMYIVVTLIEKQQKEIEELKETLKCIQDSWFEDTQKIEEMKKQIDLDNECEIALNSKNMDLEKEIEDLKEGYKIQEHNYQVAMEEIEQRCEDKIKAKIEELNKDFKEYENGQEWEIQDEIRGQIDVLQSLIEKE